MARLHILVLTSFLVAVAHSQDNVVPGPNDKNGTNIPPVMPTPAPKPTSTQPTHPTTPKPTTSRPDTTTSAPTSTSTPTTPKPSPPPTTSKTTSPPTTSKTTPPPTTAKPTPTTTSPKPTPAPTTPSPTPSTTPAPVPDPSTHTWSANVTNSNRTCLVVELAAQLELPYKVGNVSKTLKLNLPINANSTGNCTDKNKNVLKLSWDQNFLQFDFVKNSSQKNYDLALLTVSINTTAPGLNESLVHLFKYNKTEFEAPLENSYKCAAERTLNLTDTGSVGFLHISHVQVEAFRNATGTKFNEAIDCESSGTPDIVPIVVGIVLAALVVLVLVGYLFGRRRCQARGYLSM